MPSAPLRRAMIIVTVMCGLVLAVQGTGRRSAFAPYAGVVADASSNSALDTSEPLDGSPTVFSEIDDDDQQPDGPPPRGSRTGGGAKWPRGVLRPVLPADAERTPDSATGDLPGISPMVSAGWLDQLVDGFLPLYGSGELAAVGSRAPPRSA